MHLTSTKGAQTCVSPGKVHLVIQDDDGGTQAITMTTAAARQLRLMLTDALLTQSDVEMGWEGQPLRVVGGAA